MPTVTCPTCGRQIKVEMHELSLAIECDSCNARFGLRDDPKLPEKVRVVCPGCQAKIRVPQMTLGRRINCPKCRQDFVAGIEADDSAPAPEAARPYEAPPRRQSPRYTSTNAPDLDYTTTQRPGLFDELRRFGADQLGGAHRTHSGLGTASFIIALLVGGLDILLAIVIATGVARAKGRADIHDSFVGGGMAMFCMNCMSIPLCLVGVGLAIGGLLRQPGDFLSKVGLVANGTVILAVLGFYLFAVMFSP